MWYPYKSAGNALIILNYKAKAVNFGIVYGQSKYGLAKGLKITAAEADNFINKYFETYPGIKDYMHNMVELVEKLTVEDCKRIYEHYNFACLKEVMQ